KRRLPAPLRTRRGIRPRHRSSGPTWAPSGHIECLARKAVAHRIRVPPARAPAPVWPRSLCRLFPRSPPVRAASPAPSPVRAQAEPPHAATPSARLLPSPDCICCECPRSVVPGPLPSPDPRLRATEAPFPPDRSSRRVSDCRLDALSRQPLRANANQAIGRIRQIERRFYVVIRQREPRRIECHRRKFPPQQTLPKLRVLLRRQFPKQPVPLFPNRH